MTQPSFAARLNARAASVVAVVWSLFQLAVSTLWSLDAMTLRAVHIGFMLLLVFMVVPWRKEGARGTARVPNVVDALLAVAGLWAFGFLIATYPDVMERGGFLLPEDYVVGAVGVVVCMEMARRTVGNLALLAGCFLLYAFFGNVIPGAFGHAGFGWKRVTEHLFWGSQGLLGVGVGVSATYLFLFVLFGAFLKHSGLGSFINDVAMALVGRSVGGPAKVSVIASALMGMINGSAVANVATTGAMTIPLMRGAGYSPAFAAAVEAVASTGGQFAPPVMGAVGFVMAEFLGVPYTTVMLAAAIPAFLYYLSLLAAVHFEARKLGLKGLAAENIPSAVEVIKKRGILFIPVLVLVGMMFAGYTPLYAAAWAIAATVPVSWCTKDTRMTWRVILQALDEGARDALTVGVACTIIGVVVGVVSLTGLGLTFGMEVLKHIQEGQLLLAGVCVMLMSTVLGMGVPGVAAYVIVAAVAAPVLVRVGAPPLAAHMFCLIYACLSNITPPVAMSSFVAAGIARANETKTSFIAVRLGLTGFILPFFFLGNPYLLYDANNPLLPTLWALGSASVGAVFLAAGLEGWFFGAVNWLWRIVLCAASLMVMYPETLTDVAGLGILALAGAWRYWKDQQQSVAGVQRK